MPVSNIRHHDFHSGEQLFFDTNIWLHIHGPQGNPNYQRMKIYSNVYKEIITEGIKINLDLSVLEEFVNRFARFSILNTELHRLASIKDGLLKTS